MWESWLRLFFRALAVGSRACMHVCKLVGPGTQMRCQNNLLLLID